MWKFGTMIGFTIGMTTAMVINAKVKCSMKEMGKNTLKKKLIQLLD